MNELFDRELLIETQKRANTNLVERTDVITL